MSWLDHEIMHRATYCGDCGRRFDEIQGDYCYIRLGRGLICQDCKNKEHGLPPKVCPVTMRNCDSLVCLSADKCKDGLFPVKPS